MTTLASATSVDAAVQDLLRDVYASQRAELVGCRRSSGGASRNTFLLDVLVDGRARALVLQVDRGDDLGGVGVLAQAELLRAAGRAGVPVASVVSAAPASTLGGGYLLCTRIEGETRARRVLRDPGFSRARSLFALDCGRILAALHRIPLSTLPPLSSGDQLDDVVARIDAAGEPHPAFELAIGWLRAHRPAPVARTLVHGDFRLGNLLLDADGITAVLDWELAHLGDPAEDLGWLCVRAWRFGAAAEVGGMASREQLLAAYRNAGGEEVSDESVFWWQLLGTLKWGAICLSQARVHLSGVQRSVELAAIGRRVCETESDLLELLP